MSHSLYTDWDNTLQHLKMTDAVYSVAPRYCMFLYVPIPRHRNHCLLAYSFHLPDIICMFEMLSVWTSFTTCCLQFFCSLLCIGVAGGLLQFLPRSRWPARTVLQAASPQGAVAFSYALISYIKKGIQVAYFANSGMPVCWDNIAISFWWQSYCSMRRFC